MPVARSLPFVARRLAAAARRLAAAALLLSTVSCVTPQAPAPDEVTAPAGAPRAADLPEDLSGRWVLTPADGPKQYWDLVQRGSVLTGTITVDPVGLPPGETIRPREVLGNLMPLGQDWLVQLQTPSGTLRIKGSFDFQYCPDFHGVPDLSACASARRSLATPGPSSKPTASPKPTPSPSSSPAPTPSAAS